MNFMRIRITNSEALYKQGELSETEYKGKFNNKMIMAFDSLSDMVIFARAFAEDYIPKNGFENYKNLHMAKSGPADSADEQMLEFMGVKPANPIPDTWLVVPNENYNVVEEFLQEKFILKNTETEIQHIELLIPGI